MNNLFGKVIFSLTLLMSVITGCINKTGDKTNVAIKSATGATDNLALTPPMGWNSWNPFGKNVSEKVIMETADAMVSSGLKDAGYTYIVMDDYWQGTRDSCLSRPRH